MNNSCYVAHLPASPVHYLKVSMTLIQETMNFICYHEKLFTYTVGTMVMTRFLRSLGIQLSSRVPTCLAQLRLCSQSPVSPPQDFQGPKTKTTTPKRKYCLRHTGKNSVFHKFMPTKSHLVKMKAITTWFLNTANQ